MVRTRWRMTIFGAAAAAILGGASLMHAQPEPAALGKMPAFGALPTMPLPMELDLKPIAGAPYSAEAVTEVTQLLADGNRIHRKVSAAVARDSQGRTRRDMTLAAVGNWLPDDQPRLAFINDPVGRVVYMLDARRQTATRRPLPEGEISLSGAGAVTSVAVVGRVSGIAATSAVQTAEGEVRGEVVQAGTVTAVAADPAFAPGVPGIERARLRRHAEGPMATLAFTNGMEGDEDAEVESLGTQTIEGVEATGTRKTTTIPAGQIGNELPIRIVSERWYSPALQATVLSRRDDPRFGETVYRLTNINRSEPAASLFEVPAGYTVTDEPVFGEGRFIRAVPPGAPAPPK